MTLTVTAAAPPPPSQGASPSGRVLPRANAVPAVSFGALVTRSRPEAAQREAVGREATHAARLTAPPTSTAAVAPASTRPREDGARAADDPLDPVHRRRVAYAPPAALHAPLAGPASPRSVEAAPGASSVPLISASLEHLLPALVRRVAWSGDGRRGTARLEIGGGELAGAVLQVDADAGRVRVRLEVPPGVDARAWQERIERRLAGRNVTAESIEVT
jgi:hypothetical protein